MVEWQYLIVILQIKIAKHQGYKSILFDDCVYPAVIKKIENKGYTVEEYGNKSITKIIWEDENVRK